MIQPYPQWRNLFPSESAPSLDELISVVKQFNCDDTLQSLAKLNLIYSRVYRGGDQIPVDVYRNLFAPNAFELLRQAIFQKNAVFPYRPAVIFLQKLVLTHGLKVGGQTANGDPILFGRMLVAASEYAEGAKLSAVQYDDSDEAAKQKRREILAGTFYRQFIFNNSDFIMNLMGRYWGMLVLYPNDVQPLYPDEFFDLKKFFKEETGLDLEIYLMFAFALFGHYAPRELTQSHDVLQNPALFPIGDAYFQIIREEHHESARRFLSLFSRTREEFRAGIAAEIPSPDAGGYDARFIFESPLYKAGPMYFPLDLDIVMQQATSGLYWKAHSVLRTPSRKPEYDKFKTWWGRLFEWHIKKILESYLPEKGPAQRLFVEGTDGFEGADFVIRDGESLVIIEATTSPVPVMKITSGDGKAILKSLNLILIKTEHGDAGKAAQLANFIEGFKAGRIRIGNIDPKTIKYFFPVVLTEQGIPQFQPFIGDIRSEVFNKTSLGMASGWIEFWDPGEIEQLGDVIKRGLAMYIASKYLNGMGNASMANYIHATGAKMPSSAIGQNFDHFQKKVKATFFKATASEGNGEQK